MIDINKKEAKVTMSLEEFEVIESKMKSLEEVLNSNPVLIIQSNPNLISSRFQGVYLFPNKEAEQLLNEYGVVLCDQRKFTEDRNDMDSLHSTVKKQDEEIERLEEKIAELKSRGLIARIFNKNR